jgi:hypothetical protein
MKLLGYLLAGVLLAGSSANAQVAPSSLLMPSTAAALVASPAPTPAPDPVAVSARPAPALAADPVSAPASAPAAEPAAEPAPAPQGGVIGVYENYSFQFYGGYTFLRFYEAPHHIQTRNGFDTSLAYYYHAGWFGAEGSLLGAFGHQFNENSRFVFVGAGPRFRWAAPRAVEFFGHALVGGSHYVPQTAYGSQGAFGYEVGGGVDADAHHQRLSYRLELDMIGTRYFSTYQYSPKASVGIVWKF